MATRARCWAVSLRRGDCSRWFRTEGWWRSRALRRARPPRWCAALLRDAHTSALCGFLRRLRRWRSGGRVRARRSAIAADRHALDGRRSRAYQPQPRLMVDHVQQPTRKLIVDLDRAPHLDRIPYRNPDPLRAEQDVAVRLRRLEPHIVQLTTLAILAS